MTEPISRERLAEIRERAFAATVCPKAAEPGGAHTWSRGSFMHVECGACRYTRASGDGAEETTELLAEIRRLAARVAELELVPRCGATTPSVFENADPLGPCILDHGHGGMHQEASTGIPPIPGARWTEHNDPLAVAHARIRELEAELAGFETLWGVRYGVAKTGISEDEPDTYTTERESEEDARQWRDEYAADGEVVTCRISPWRAVDEDQPTPTENGSTVE